MLFVYLSEGRARLLVPTAEGVLLINAERINSLYMYTTMIHIMCIGQIGKTTVRAIDLFLFSAVIRF